MSRRRCSSLLLASLIGILTPLAGPVGALAAVSPTDDADAIAQAIMAGAPQLTGATWQQRPWNIASSATATDFGTQPASAAFPSDGDTFAILSSGHAWAADDARGAFEVSGSGWGSDRGDSHDVTELRLDINVPSTANCLSLDFSFLSEEWPDYVNDYNDAFIAELDTSDWTASATTVSAPHNFAFDGDGDAVTINSGGLAALSAAEAAGTVYNGATRRLSASTPITPGAHAIYLSISDNGDTSLDSAAFVDNLRMGQVADPETGCAAGARSAPPDFQRQGETPPSATGPEGSVLRTSGRFDAGGVALQLAISPNPGTFESHGDGTWSWSLFADDDLRLDAITVSAAGGLGFGFGASASFDAIATNVAPTVTPSDANDTEVDEGSVHTFGYAIADPGADTITSVVTSCGPGTKVAGSDAHTNTGGSLRCEFPDGPRAALVTVQATDDDGGVSAEASQLVSVGNVAPTVTFESSAVAFDEGPDQRMFAYTISDPGRDSITAVATDCGDGGRVVEGSAQHTDTGGSFACTFADGPAAPVVTATATDSDGRSGDAGRLDVAVRDVAPSVTLDAGNPATVDEGAAEVTFRLWTHDPGDDAVSLQASCGDQGSKVPGSDVAGGFACVFADGDAVSTITATPTDSDGVTGATDTQVVSIRNVAPQVTMIGGAARTVDEGPAERTFAYRVDDPGRDVVAAVATSCGAAGEKVAGSDANGDAEGKLRCVFADGPASGAVTVGATDSDGASGALAAQAVTVRNVAPTVVLAPGNPQSVDEGRGERTYGYAISDPGADIVTAVATSCGAAGDKVPGSDRHDDRGGSLRCVFETGPAGSELTVRATDSDDATGAADRQTVVVHDPPIVAVGADVAGVETSDLSRTVATFTDPTPYATAGEYTASIDWGDGSQRSEGMIRKTDSGTFTITGSHAYARFGGYEVSVRIADADNPANATTARSAAAISDAPIHVTGTPAVTPRAFSGAVATFSDDATPDGAADEFSATIDWGDGSPRSTGTVSRPAAGGDLRVAGSHVYASAGRFVPTVVVTSVGASTDTATASFVVYAFATASANTFAISDAKAQVGSHATFWGSNWQAANPFVSGVVYGGSFRGYLEAPASPPPACGNTWIGRTGASAAVPATVPPYLAVVVANGIAKSGSTVGGTVVKIVVVETDPGYGSSGTGKVVADVCAMSGAPGAPPQR